MYNGHSRAGPIDSVPVGLPRIHRQVDIGHEYRNTVPATEHWADRRDLKVDAAPRNQLSLTTGQGQLTSSMSVAWSLFAYFEVELFFLSSLVVGEDGYGDSGSGWKHASIYGALLGSS